jgi:hypothetical protein
MSRNKVWGGAFAGLLLACVGTAVAAADAPATSLGQSWPNATDVSRSPRFHVYVFSRDGIRYVQINDLNGNVRGAFATANGTFIVLPMGADATRVQAPGTASATPKTSNTSSEVIYQDGQTTVTAAPQAAGAMSFQAQSVDSTCNDPAECSSRVN